MKITIESDLENKPVRTSLKWGVLIIFVIVILGIVGSCLGTIGSVATAPGRVIGKTLQTDNIIQNYEWFYDVNAGYDARLAQVREFETLQDEAVSDRDKSQLRTELSAMRQTCRALATKYNANSQKMNTQIFKGWSLPETLSENQCEKPE